MAIKLAVILIAVAVLLMGLSVVAKVVLDIIERTRDWRRRW